jgi:hypothetical protein
MSPVLTTGADGQTQFQINMLPAVAVLHPFPFLDIFSKTTVPTFLRKFKIAKMSAPTGSSKTMKSCINPLLWPNIARIISPSLDVMTFRENTTDAEIYAALLKKYGARSADEAMLQLKEIVFKFDDSISPQDQFAGVLISHFNEVKEQLSQFLYCQFVDELTPEAIQLCLKDNFLHNPFIKGPKGESVRQSSNNAFILEKLALWKRLPLSEMMDKIVEIFEEEEASSRRKGYKVVPWLTPKSSDRQVQGGIKKFRNDFNSNRSSHNSNRNSNNNANRARQDRELCCKCGRPHEATIDQCLLFDHPSAGKEPTWPPGKKPLELENPSEWATWLDSKSKTHPSLVDKVRKKHQENHGGGGRPPRYPSSTNQQKHRNASGKFVNHSNYSLSVNHLSLLVGGVHESDGAKHGHADHVTIHDDAEAELSSVARSRVETCSSNTESGKLPIEELIWPVFSAVGRFKRGKTRHGKNYPANRRCYDQIRLLYGATTYLTSLA